MTSQSVSLAISRFCLVSLFSLVLLPLGSALCQEGAADQEPDDQPTPSLASQVGQSKSTQDKGGFSVAMIIGVMVLSGLIGGTINHMMGTGIDKEGYASWGKSIFIGVGAALLIPLFLNTISSTLLTNIVGESNQSRTENSVDLLVFSGFCILAAISSQAFIRRLSDELIAKKLKETNEKVEKNEREVKGLGDVVEVMVESEPDQSEQGTTESITAPTLTDENRSVLMALKHDRFKLRSLEGVARDANVATNDAEQKLESLASSGLVKKLHTREGVGRWSLTQEGRENLDPSSR